MNRSEALLEATRRHVPRGLAIAHPIALVSGQGATVWDAEGRAYTDLIGGIGVLNVGHAHPRVMQAAKAQMERLTHTSFQVAMYEGYVRLAERLNGLVPIDGAAKTAFFTTGAEAVENAVKIARSFTGRPAIVAFTAAFHGRTLLGMSLTGKARPYKQNFGPFAPAVHHAPFPYPYRGTDEATALRALEELFATQVAPDQVAAVIFEPVAGEGGFLPMPPGFLRSLRALTREHGILLIDDEIQTGFGRTGKLFAIEHTDVLPDLIASAKSLAGGFPLSAVSGRAEVMDAPTPGGLGGTYGGNPVAVAAALAVLDVLGEERLLERSLAIGERILERFRSAQAELDVIGEVRGLGGMVAMELVTDAASRTPAGDLTDDALRRAREAGVLALKAGMHGNVIRVLVPLVVDDAQLDLALDVLLGAVRDAARAAERVRLDAVATGAAT
jgi:4-aminobutyrate aminotransferase / (S)-3-amino-2-methylpropionate transaminase / 5-aminovalerate transaminase